MKAFIMAADALTPDYIFGKKELFPNIYKMIGCGASAAFSAYVQRGYKGSYSSEQNWASIYTGLSPDEHEVDYAKAAGIEGKAAKPQMKSLSGKQPFWEVLNKAGISVGLWSPECCNNPVDINGYVVASKYTPIFSPSENREAPREIQLNRKDMYIQECLYGSPPPRLYPRTLEQQGYTFKQLRENPSLVNSVANENAFINILDNFDEELRFWFSSMTKAQRRYPVDVMYLFTPSTDIIPHFSMYCDYNPIIIKAYQFLDKYIGEFIEAFKPEATVLLSDHGQQNFKDLIKCSDPVIQREAFVARDQVVWMDNGYIAFEAMNGGLLFSAHSLKGVFIASGNSIRNIEITDMRTLDVYPTILELLGTQVPANRKGFVADIFDKTLINPDKLLKPVSYKKIAIIQSHEVNITDIFINEIYINNRFSAITVIGEKRYCEIFLNNPRVIGFTPFEEFNPEDFDEIYNCVYNARTKLMRHIQVK